MTFCLNDAPAGLVVPRPEVPLVVDESLGFTRLQGVAILVDVYEGAVAELRVVGKLHPGLFEQVVGEHTLRILQVALDGLQVQLGAVLEQLFKLLLRDRLARRVAGAVLLHPELR